MFFRSVAEYIQKISVKKKLNGTYFRRGTSYHNGASRCCIIEVQKHQGSRIIIVLSNDFGLIILPFDFNSPDTCLHAFLQFTPADTFCQLLSVKLFWCRTGCHVLLLLLVVFVFLLFICFFASDKFSLARVRTYLPSGGRLQLSAWAVHVQAIRHSFCQTDSNHVLCLYYVVLALTSIDGHVTRPGRKDKLLPLNPTSTSPALS